MAIRQFTAITYHSGNSLVVTVPKFLVDEGYIEEGVEYEISFKKKGVN